MDLAAAIQSNSGIPDRCFWIGNESPAKGDQSDLLFTHRKSIRNRDLRH